MLCRAIQLDQRCLADGTMWESITGSERWQLHSKLGGQLRVLLHKVYKYILGVRSISLMYYALHIRSGQQSPEHDIHVIRDTSLYVMSRRSISSYSQRLVIRDTTRYYRALRVFVVSRSFCICSVSKYLTRYFMLCLDAVLRHVSKYLSETLRILSTV